jgi:hypothetical protein
VQDYGIVDCFYYYEEVDENDYGHDPDCLDTNFDRNEMDGHFAVHERF